jgi:hypothetical protein
VNADRTRGGYRGQVVTRDDAGLVTAARFDYPEYWRWVRVEVEDEHGRRAWGNPFRLPGEEPASRPGAFEY